MKNVVVKIYKFDLKTKKKELGMTVPLEWLSKLGITYCRGLTPESIEMGTEAYKIFEQKVKLFKEKNNE